MEKGYDAGKKVSGIKRHIAVDTQGLPHAIAVTTADITDRKGCLLALERDKDNLGAVQKVLADGGYTGKAFASSVQALIGAEVEIAKRNELHRFAVLPKRWVVERSFSWLEKNRRLWKNCERKLSTSLQMVALAFLGVLLRRLVLNLRSQFFQSRLFFSNQEKLRSTTHRFGNTAKRCNSFRLTISTSAPINSCTDEANALPV